jgi:hypothetical protein
MRRIILRSVGVALCTWLEFAVFPGHSYLQDGTQLTVPMLERLINPGFLSRDLVATHGNLQFTAYDEATLFLHQAGLAIRTALLSQQIASRVAGVLGILLLALSAGTGEWLALLVAACVNLGARLVGPNVMVIGAEAVPSALAWGPLVLAMGLLSRYKPLLAGLAAGLALIYDPVLTAPFCCVLIIAFVFDRSLRRLLRPSVTILAVFVLLLANLAQLQPGVSDQQPLFSTIPPPYVVIQQFRTPYEWVSLWSGGEFWSYFAVWVCGLWAVVRIWPALNRQSRWLFLLLPMCGAAIIPVSYVLLDRFRWTFISRSQPGRWLAFTFALSVTACWIAGIRAARERRFRETALWLLVPFAVPFRAEVLQLLRIARIADLARLSLAVLLAWASARLLISSRRRLQWSVAAIPVLAIACLRLQGLGVHLSRNENAVTELADWVQKNTWGSSMFLFSDLGRSGDSGVFRARSRRALWVDWNGGTLVPCSQSFAGNWWNRWQQSIEPGYSLQRLQAHLALPIDYYVLSPQHRLAAIRPVFANSAFLVYDANDLRNAPAPLRAANNP